MTEPTKTAMPMSITERAWQNMEKNRSNVDKASTDAQKIHLGPVSFPDFGFFRSKDDNQAIAYAQRYNQIMNDVLKQIGDIEMLLIRDTANAS